MMIRVWKGKLRASLTRINREEDEGKQKYKQFIHHKSLELTLRHSWWHERSTSDIFT